MRIIGPPTLTHPALREAVRRLGAHERFFGSIDDPLWAECENHLIDPVVAAALSAHETGWWKYPGVVPWQHHNLGGIKNRYYAELLPKERHDAREAHHEFASWARGALGLVEHLCAYSGAPLRNQEPTDPRYTVARAKNVNATHVNELGGHWAPRASYGISIEDVMRRIYAAVSA